MIDLANEHLVTFSQAARLRPPGRLGRPTHTSTVYRWYSRGLRGHRLGGTLYTSCEALQRFAERLSGCQSITTPEGVDHSTTAVDEVSSKQR
jgi:hypothetical protein